MAAEMTFVVNKVTLALDNREQVVELVQDEPMYVNPNYRGCRLYLGVIDDDEIKKYGPGTPLKVTLGE